VPIIITGADGFIGKALCKKFSNYNNVLGIDIKKSNFDNKNIKLEIADLTDFNKISDIFKKHIPDVVIHCAGIAHQKIGKVDSATYIRVNSVATENFAKAAAKANSDVSFIFFSSVSVYGEDNLQVPISEEKECHPSSDYAVSKLDAERRLIALANEGIINSLFILRLAPVYDREWSLNLDRRVFATGKLTYLRFGSGSQKMSALARPNLIDFIAYLIETKLVTEAPQYDHPDPRDRRRFSQIKTFNVCDAKQYEFNKIIQVFKKSGIHPNRYVISVPLLPVWVATRIAGAFFQNKRKWFHSCYDKLASSLVFNNTKMLRTGFKPRHTLETIFNPQIEHLTQSRKDAKK